MTKYIRAGARGFSPIELTIAVAMVAILAGPIIDAVRNYIADAKAAEARSSLAQIGMDAQTAFERSSSPQAPDIRPRPRVLCFSAAQTVPLVAASIRGRKYQSAASDWDFDFKKPGTGFACLRFSMSAPQYYMYNYVSGAGPAAPTSFTATANGDLNGDGKLSTFTLTGSVGGDTNLHVAPALVEIDPYE